MRQFGDVHEPLESAGDFDEGAEFSESGHGSADDFTFADRADGCREGM